MGQCVPNRAIYARDGEGATILGRAGSEIEFETASGRAAAYRAVPASECGPGVLVLDASGGRSDFSRESCDRLARAGFVALAPDFFPEEPATDTHPEPRTADLDAAVRELQSCHATEGSRVGALGFAAGGGVALRAAAGNRRIGAVALCYGLESGSTIELGRFECPVLGIFGGRDVEVEPEAVREFEEKLGVAGVSVKTVTYENALHGFMDESRPDVHDAVAASAAWDALLAFLRAEL